MRVTYRNGMCDLTAPETDAIVAQFAEINALTAQIDGHAASIAETAYMDHDTLAALLTVLRDKADAAGRWVADKPHEHAGHDTTTGAVVP